VPRSVLITIVVAIVAISTLVLFLAILPPVIVTNADVPASVDRIRLQNDVRALGVQLVGGVVLVVGVYFSWRTLLQGREGLITDRFSRAVDQLGSTSTDVRIGGIFGLERLARSSSIDHGPIMEILVAFIRQRAPVSTAASPIASDVQAALTVLTRRTRRFDSTILPLDLSDIDLSGARLANSDLSGICLARSLLAGADMRRARLEGVDISGAHLISARLGDSYWDAKTQVKGALFTGANLGGAHMQGANLRIAWWDEADFGGADLRGTDVRGLDLRKAKHLSVMQQKVTVSDERTQFPAPAQPSPKKAKDDPGKTV